jgi:hypothetical protein
MLMSEMLSVTTSGSVVGNGSLLPELQASSDNMMTTAAILRSLMW